MFRRGRKLLEKMGFLSLGNPRKGHIDVDVVVVLHSELAAIEVLNRSYIYKILLYLRIDIFDESCCHNVASGEL